MARSNMREESNKIFVFNVAKCGKCALMDLHRIGGLLTVFLED